MISGAGGGSWIAAAFLLPIWSDVLVGIAIAAVGAYLPLTAAYLYSAATATGRNLRVEMAEGLRQDVAEWRERVSNALDQWPHHQQKFGGDVSITMDAFGMPAFMQEVSACVDILDEMIRQIAAE
ncbi:MAG: hypothetical protein ACRDY3_03215 [Acidimicrobiales bacterium]